MSKLCIVAMMVVMVVILPSTNAQHHMGPKCVEDLMPCHGFINSTTVKPPKDCCKPLALVFKDQLPCLCGVFTNVTLIQTLSINVTEAMTLPMRCGLKDDLMTACKAASPPGSTPGTPETPKASAPPVTNDTKPAPPPKGNTATKNIALAAPLSGLMMLLAASIFF